MTQHATSSAERLHDNEPQDVKEVVEKAREKGLIPIALAESNLAEAQRLANEVGLGAETEIAELKALAKRTVEVTNAFASRAERISAPYVCSPEVRKALRIARILKKPLLLEGEPGTGKTSLAYALAGEEDLPIIHCRGKSTLTAQSAMYEIDYVARLNDATLSQAVPETMRAQTEKWRAYLEGGGDSTKPEFRAFMESFESASKLLNMGRISDVRHYITYGELGEAIIRAAQGEKVILLFDEIDKAKREFPNDLLDELEHLTMRIRETGEEISAPSGNIIVMVTSNHERDLPEPFLRRCVYTFLEFPKPEQMTEIVKAHIPTVNETLLESAIDTFYKIRGTKGIQKEPSTSEMLDWIRVLMDFGVKDVTDKAPLLEALVKTKEDADLISTIYSEKNKKTDAELLKENAMPEEVISALQGRRVFSLTVLPGYSYDKRSSQIEQSRTSIQELYLTLANAGYKFMSADYDNRFEILESGIKREGDYFVVTGEKGAEIYRFLNDLGYVSTEYVTSTKPISFSQIIRSNGQYTVGMDSEGRHVFKTNDGMYIYALTSEELRKGAVNEARTQMAEAFYRGVDGAEKRGGKRVRIY